MCENRAGDSLKNLGPLSSILSPGSNIYKTDESSCANGLRGQAVLEFTQVRLSQKPSDPQAVGFNRSSIRIIFIMQIKFLIMEQGREVDRIRIAMTG